MIVCVLSRRAQAADITPLSNVLCGCDASLSIRSLHNVPTPVPLPAQTLNHMHMDTEVCHGDITPGNIMLQSSPASPWDAVRLIDFGFATDFDSGAIPDTTRHACASTNK